MEKRSKPECALPRIKELATRQAVHYASSRVQNHTDALEYSFETVCECLAQLAPEDFHHAERYSADGHWLDVYLMTFIGPSNHEDDLYIKLKLTSDCLCVVLLSFHAEGAL